MENALYGGIEAGGTKFVCAVGTAPDDIQARITIPTTTPEETLQKAVEFFADHPSLQAIGVASFGPIDLDPLSDTYGCIGTTPKAGWQGVDYRSALSELSTVLNFASDVEAAALAELTVAAYADEKSLLYMTVGTGIGGAIARDGTIQRGLGHAEMGHQLIPRQTGDEFLGTCKFHGTCLEGLASGAAIEARCNQRAEHVASDNIVWQQVAHYLAVGLFNIFLTTTPERIIIGGGILQHQGLLAVINQEFLACNSGYIENPLVNAPGLYITAPRFGSDSGIYGALLLAQQAA
jgi:fructokinase